MKNFECENIILKEEKVKYMIKDEEIEVIEKYYINTENGERVYNRDISIENDIAAYDAYKRKKGLLTTNEIKAIREKYGLNQKEYAFAIGVGEITVHRFENGTIQSESIDAIMRLSDEPKNMENLAMQNKDKLGEEVFNKLIENISILIKNKEHKIANINIDELTALKFSTVDVNIVSEAIISEYNEYFKIKEDEINTDFLLISPLELQKFLYFVNGISLAVYDKPAFDEPISAWTHGPVVESIYHKYKGHGRYGIETSKNNYKITSGLRRIINEVVKAYGKYSGGQLIDITHEEEPWMTTAHNQVIDNYKIKNYFKKIYLS